MRKLVTALLSILLILPVFRVSALEKSIEELSEETSVSNAEASIIIPYGEGTARVYYGENGINLFTPEGRVVLETNYAVQKLISVGDIDKDGYVDFLTYQLVPDEVAQLMCISGLDGHVISSMRETRDDYNNALGINVVVNCFIQQMLSAEDGTAYVICDYSIIRYNMADGTDFTRKANFTNVNRIFLQYNISVRRHNSSCYRQITGRFYQFNTADYVYVSITGSQAVTAPFLQNSQQ